MSYLRFELLLNEDFTYVLKNLIDSASKRIYIATYVASVSKVLKNIYYGIALKFREGVDVKVVLNGASEEALRINVKTAEFLRNLGVSKVKLTKRFTHIKLYIIDNYFIIGSHNLTALPFRQDISVMVYSKEMCGKLSKLFKELLVREATSAMVYRDVVGGTYYEVLANYEVLKDIYEKTKYASDRVKVMMYIATLSKATKKYYELLLKKQGEGVDVAVLLNGASELALKYNSPVYNYLKSIGVKKVLLTKNYIHSKLLVIDDIAVIGSHNLTASSVAGRLELSLAIKSSNLANALNYLIESIWEKHNSQLITN